MLQPDSASIVARIRSTCPPGGKVVFVSGSFNIVHPGHLRLINFAATCGDYLVVGVHPDGFEGVHLPEAVRLEGVQSIAAVGHAFVLREPDAQFIARLQPEVVVKGKEHEAGDNPELRAVESYGGKLLFTSGETRFSLLDIVQKELQQANLSAISKPRDYLERHGFRLEDLAALIARFSSLKVVVVGDLIVDDYISCAPVGMSQEDPTIVVTPIMEERFVGGAAIVAAHARGLGAAVSYFCVAGRDGTADFALERLRAQGVQTSCVYDESRPTTLKQRYRASGKTLLRVSHLREHGISQNLCDSLFECMSPGLRKADLLVFSDFNYGCLPQPLVDRISTYCRRHGAMMVADSQSSSQVGDVSRFRGMRLLTPTEREARLAMRDFSSGLVVLAESLRKTAQARDVIVTLGSEGMLVQTEAKHAGDMVTDRLPALNSAPKDVAGAGDSLLIASSMGLAVGADIWQASYLGSIAAACQVGRVGNSPLSASEVAAELQG